MGSKKIFLILGLVATTLLGGKAYASIESTCAKSTGWYPGIQNNVFNNWANTGIIENYSLCVSEARRMSQQQANIPANPGSPPVYNCAQYDTALLQTQFTLCKNNYEIAKTKYDADLKIYQGYMANNSNMYTEKKLSAAQIIEDVAAKQQKAADELSLIATILTTVGGIMVGVGTAMIIAVVSAAAGLKLVIAGAALMIFGFIIQAKAKQMLLDKVTTCDQLNKILTKPMNCDDVKPQSTIDGTFTPVNYGLNGTGGTSDIPAFIDGTTGKCKAPVTPECSAIVKNSPKDCFKANAKGMSCMAGMKTKPMVTTLSNGKISMNINGKQRTFGAEDFADEASMVKAGFTPTQAKQFLTMSNDPNSILAKTGLNSKGEIKASTMIMPTANLAKPAGGEVGGGTPASSMTTKKDEYGPVQEVARTPASAEGLTKDYHGDTIGAEGDNVFKMINRRYNLKQKQNIFIDQ